MRLGLRTFAVALAVLALGVLIARRSAESRRDDAVPPAKSSTSDVTSVSTQVSTPIRSREPQKASVPEQVASTPERVIRHRGLPASLADIPRTPEFEQALESARKAKWTPPGNEEGLLDYHLRFRNRLETCLGTPPPSAGDITYEVLFQPRMTSDGKISSLGSANRVSVEESHGLNEADHSALERCGAKAAYGLPLDFKFLPTEPDFRLHIFLKFPIDQNSFPYKVLKTGQR